MIQTIILLDMDGVLIRARGYRESIRAALQHVFAQMNQPHLTPPQETDMLSFEAQSIIFEWDSAPIMLASLLNQVPDLWEERLAVTLAKIAESGRQLRQPDFAALARQCPPAQAGLRPARATLGSLFPENALFTELLSNSHNIQAPMTHLIQNFVLGSDQFAHTYGLPPLLETDSYLEIHDKPALTPENRDRLSADSNFFPAIYTARPSLPPSFESDWRGYPPEGEIGQRLLGWLNAPLVGYGKMQWLARQQGLDPSDYVKPSPMHGLVGIFSALLYGQADWERRAFELALAPHAMPTELTQTPWRVVVVEDSPNSIKGVRQAVEQLSAYHAVECIGVGIAHADHHIQKLQPVADYIAPDVNQGLAMALGW